MRHEKIAEIVLKRLRVTILSSPLVKIRAGGARIEFRWDGAGKTPYKKLVFVEVEPPFNFNVNHIRLHVVNLALISHFRPVEKLIWVIDTSSQDYHNWLVRELEIWKNFLTRVLNKELPPMEIRNRSGRLLKTL